MKKRLIIIAYSIIPIIVLSLISYETGFGGPITKNQARSALLEFTKGSEDPDYQRQYALVKSAKIKSSDGITTIGNFRCCLQESSWSIGFSPYGKYGFHRSTTKGRFYRDLTGHWRAQITGWIHETPLPQSAD